ncbi:MAG: helix-turn-helix domain-containing protein [Niabella sp.]
MNIKVRHISYDILPPNVWFQKLEGLGLGKCKDTGFQLDKTIGDGEFSYLIFQEGLWIQQMNFRLYEQWDINLRYGENNDIFVIYFYLTKAVIQQRMGEKSFQYNYDNFSMLMTYSKSTVNYILPAYEDLRMFRICATREWLENNIVCNRNMTLAKIFNTQNNMFFIKNTDFKYKRLLGEMQINESNKLLLLSNTILIIRYFFESLEDEAYLKLTNTIIHPSDLENLLAVKTLIDNYPLKKNQVNELAVLARMSLTKFKRLFKLITGDTPYHYQMKIRLAIAMEMLSEKKYSISEIAFLIGYSNVSKFTTAFTKQYHILPSDVK